MRAGNPTLNTNRQLLAKHSDIYGKPRSHRTSRSAARLARNSSEKRRRVSDRSCWPLQPISCGTPYTPRLASLLRDHPPESCCRIARAERAHRARPQFRSRTPRIHLAAWNARLGTAKPAVFRDSNTLAAESPHAWSAEDAQMLRRTPFSCRRPAATRLQKSVHRGTETFPIRAES